MSNITVQDIANAIEYEELGKIVEIQLRTSRRSIRHAIVELEWNNHLEKNHHIQALMNMGATICISYGAHSHKKFHAVLYRADSDTKCLSEPVKKNVTRKENGFCDLWLPEKCDKKNVVETFDLEYGEDFHNYGMRILYDLGIIP